MKKIYSIILVAASLAVAACQPKELDNTPVDVNPAEKSVKITATIEDFSDTKVTYDVSDVTGVKPTWAIGDELFGFDAGGKTFTYVVTNFDEDEAIIEPKEGTSYIPSEGTVVYGIYYPNKDVNNIDNGTLTIDLAGQTGNLEGTTPAIMCATATVINNEIRFKFENQTAIIGLKKIQVGSTANKNLKISTPVSQIAIEGVITHGKLSVVNGKLALTPGTKTSTVYAVPTPSSWTTDDKGQIEFGGTTPVAFAVLPHSGTTPNVYAYTEGAAFKNSTPISGNEIEAGSYYHMSKKLDVSGEPVASLTVGSVTSLYYNVNDAFDAADCSNANCTVTLLKECSATRQIALSNADCSGAVTLDLNSKTLTAITDDIGLYVRNRSLTIKDSGENGAIVSNSSNKYALYLNTGANVTLNGGSINSDYRAVGIINSGNFTMNGGTISSTGYGIALGGSGDISVTGGSISGSRAIYSITLTGDVTFTGTLSISGGTLEGTSGYGIYNTAGTVNITGGNVSSTSNVIASSGIVNIDGGTFTSSSTSSATIYISGAGAVGTISGGQFNSNALSTISASSDGTAYVTGGLHSRAVQEKYAVDANNNEYVNLLNTDNGTKATYPFAVGLVSDNPIVDHVEQGSNVWNHASLEGAFINAGHRAVVSSATNTTITQVAEATISGTINVNSGNLHSIILDLNGKVVSATDITPMIDAASDFTLMDSDGAGELNTTGNVALSVTGGTTTVNSGSLVGKLNAVTVAADATLTVNNGYFYGAENGVDVVGVEGAGITLNNGWYRNKPSSDYLDPKTSAISGAETHNTLTYNWTIGVETAVVEVNGVGYASLGAAVAEANALGGAAETVTIKLLVDIADESQFNITNVNGKSIVLDLNGCTLSTETESFITTSGSLTITDNNNDGGGQILSTNKNVLYLNNSSADVSVDKCLIKSTFTAASTSGAQTPNNSIIYLANSAKLSVTGNAKIWATAAHVCYAAACTLNIDNAELTSSNYCIYVGGAANISISGAATSFYATSGNLLMYCNSASASIEVSGGYFYRNSTGSTPISSNNIDKYTFTGGHFSAVPTNATAASGYRFDEDAVSHTHATTDTDLSYGYGVLYGLPNVADVNGTTYTSFADALSDANAYDGEDATVTLTLLRDVSMTHATFSHASKNMTLDINGHTLSGTDSAAVRYTASNTFNIVDNGPVKGKITSTKESVIAKGGSTAATINITGCTITSSATGMDYYHEAVVYFLNAAATLNITNCVIYSTGSLTGVTVIAGTANISGSEISSGTESTGLVGVCAYNSTASVTINSGCFYTSNTTSTRPAAYAASGSFTINGGFFYGGATSIRASSASNFESKFTVKGGYFNNQPLFSGHTPTYDGCSLESVSETYTHSIKGTLNFSYQAVPSAGEASVDASTSEPVVTLGEAKTGGVSF